VHSAAKIRRLRELLARPGIVYTLAPHDAFSALLMEQAGLECLFLGGFGTSASMLGLPDLNLLTATEMADAVRRLSAVLRVPLIADGDTGHGDLHNVRRTVELFEQAGASGILLEDQVHPKRCGHFHDKRVVPAVEFVERIRAAVQARSNPAFVIFARTDARQSEGLESAIDRVNRCANAGADAAFVEAPQSVEELERIPRDVRLPTLANMLTGGVTPIVPVPELGRMGYKFAVAPVESLMVCGRAIQDLAHAWLARGRVDDLAGPAMGFDALKRVLRVDEILRGPPAARRPAAGADQSS
jgi:2-methylisocitrate lyase-like PEP mutase family enzyme